MPTVDITLQPNVVESSVETSVVEFTDTSVTVEVPNVYPVVEFVSSVAGSIIAGEGLTGGGNFTGNVPIALSPASISSLNKAETALQPGGLLSALVDDVGYATDAEVQALLDGTGGIYQPINANLTAISGITTTVFGRSFLTLANDVAARTLLGVYSTSQVYTKAEVDALVETVEGGVWGQITGSLSAQADLMSAFNTKANLTHSHSAADITSGSWITWQVFAAGLEIAEWGEVKGAGYAGFGWNDTTAPLNEKWWGFETIAGQFFLTYWTDNFSVTKYALTFDRTGEVLTSITYGNAVDSPTHTFYGPMTVSGQAVVVTNDSRLSDARTPLAHAHIIADVTGLQTALDGKSVIGHTHLWADITDKPTTFTPSAHVHSGADITSGTVADARLSSNVALKNSTQTFTGNLRVENAGPWQALGNTGQLTDEKFWLSIVSGKSWVLRAYNDGLTSSKNALAVTRGTGTAITGMAYGNSTDNPSHTFYGAANFATSLTVGGTAVSLAGHTHGDADITSLAWSKLTGVPSAFNPVYPVGVWQNDDEGNPRAYFGGSSHVTNGIIFRASRTDHEFQFRNSANTIVWNVSELGTLTIGSVPWTRLTSVPSTFTPSAHTHVIADVTGLQAELDAKAPLASPTFTGTVTAPAFSSPNPNNTGATIGLNWVGDAPRFRIGGSGAGAAAPFTIQGTGDFVRLSVDASGNLSVPGTITGVGSGLTSLNASNVSTGTLSDSRLSSNVPLKNAIQTFTEQQTFRWAKQELHGLVRNNLGDPTLPEMALFETQFDNKLWFYPHAQLTFERSDDGTTWVAESPTQNQKEKFVSGNGSILSGIAIPRTAQKYRVIVRNKNSYVYLNALYLYWSTQGNTASIKVFKRRDADGVWIEHTSDTSQKSSWPGHIYLPFNTIPWSMSTGTSTHYQDVCIEFTPTWTHASNVIALYGMQLWGGYPAGRRTIYDWDEFQNVTFPAAVAASTLTATTITASSAVKAATTSTAEAQVDLSSNNNAGYARAFYRETDQNFGLYYAPSSVAGLTLLRFTPTAVQLGNGSRALELYGLSIEMNASASWTNTANTTGFDIGLLGGTADARAYIYQRHNSDIVFGTNNTERMRIQAAGVVNFASTPTVGGTAVSLTNHTHSYLSTGYLTGRSTTDGRTVDDVGIGAYYHASTSVDLPSGVTDQSLLSLSYSADWTTQIGHDWRTNTVYIRSQNSGVWGSWAELSKVGHTHSYLPLAGGTLTGWLTMDGGNVTTQLQLGSSAAVAKEQRIRFISSTLTAGIDVILSGGTFGFYDRNATSWLINVNQSTKDVLLYGVLTAPGITSSSNLTVTGGYIYGPSSKDALQMTDTWLRLNPAGDFTSGVYTPGVIRLDGNLYMSSDSYITRIAANRFGLGSTTNEIMTRNFSASSAKITRGTADPTGGADGDIYLQYT